MRIGVLAEGLLEWGGGIDFLRIICDSLRLAMPEAQPAMVLLVPRTDVVAAIRQGAPPWFGWFVASVRRRQIQPWRELLREQQDRLPARRIDRVREAIRRDLPVLRFHGDGELEAIARAERLDCLLPSFRALSAEVRTPWIGYLYDFQHRHLPHLFNAADRAARDERFYAMAGSACHVIVNS